MRRPCRAYERLPAIGRRGPLRFAGLFAEAGHCRGWPHRGQHVACVTMQYCAVSYRQIILHRVLSGNSSNITAVMFSADSSDGSASQTK